MIVINNTPDRIKYIAAGDLKWLSAVSGINAGNSLYPCPWCTWKVKDKAVEADIHEKFSIRGRSHENGKICLEKKKDKSSDARQGYIEKSLFSFIEFDSMVVDVLHMYLRITDKLIAMLLVRLEKLEGNKSSDLTQRPLTSIFKKFLEIDCNITLPFFTKIKDSKAKTKLRQLNSNERMKIFNKLFEDDKALIDLFPKKYKTDATLVCLNKLYHKFKIILEIIKRDNRQNFDKKALISLLKEWLKEFITIEPKITPYIHILCFHVPEFIEVHGNLNLFSMQGLEKLNHFAKSNYFRQTNHHKSTFTSTLLEKMNRIDFIHLGGQIDEANQEKEITDEADEEEEENEEEKDKYKDMFDFLLEDEK